MGYEHHDRYWHGWSGYNYRFTAALAAATTVSALAYAPDHDAEKKRLAALKEVKRTVLGPKRSRWQ